MSEAIESLATGPADSAGACRRGGGEPAWSEVAETSYHFTDQAFWVIIPGGRHELRL